MLRGVCFNSLWSWFSVPENLLQSEIWWLVCTVRFYSPNGHTPVFGQAKQHEKMMMAWVLMARKKGLLLTVSLIIMTTVPASFLSLQGLKAHAYYV